MTGFKAKNATNTIDQPPYPPGLAPYDLFLFPKLKLPLWGTPQVENSEARQYLQLAQYCASCNQGVIPVLPVNTVLNIGIVLAYYWRRTGVVFFDSTAFKYQHSTDCQLPAELSLGV